MVGNGIYDAKILGLQYEKGNVFIKGRICLEYLIVSYCAHGGPFGCFGLALGSASQRG